MKIGIDCRMYGSGFGLARYIQQLVKHLLEIDLENQYILFFKSDNLKEFIAGSNKNVKIVIADIPWYSWVEQIKFKKIIKRQEIDLMHFPHWNIPLNYNDSFVVTIHDLIMYHYPRPEATTLGPIKFWIKDKLHRIVLEHAIKKAKHIIVTSEFTKQDVHNTLDIELDKMTVTYQAPFINKTQNADNKIEILEKFNIIKPYILYVGSAYPHKNLENLLKAWEIFKKKYGYEYQLVLVGKNNYFYNKLKQSNKLLNNQVDKNSVVFTDFVSDNVLVELYKKASLYVFPSKYEGFGLPPLEAQQYDVPVISSNASCLPEVLGESVLYFNPENIEQMVDILYQGISNEDIRFKLKQNAKENLKRFSWDRLAQETLDIYFNFFKLNT